jgi:hypothetical protein
VFEQAFNYPQVVLRSGNRFDIGEAGYAFPHHRVAWRCVMGTSKIATKSGKLGGHKVLTAASADKA